MADSQKRTSYKQGGTRTDGPRRQTGVSKRPRQTGSAERSGAPFPIFKAAIVVVIIIAAVLVLRVCSAAVAIDITVNGTQYTIHGAKTLQTAIDESGLPINPGDLISIRGLVLKKSAGDPFTATVNGQEVTDPNYGLHNGDVLEVSDGKDVLEEYDTVEEAVPHEAIITGAGAVHQITAGEDGVLQIRTGKVSGEVIERQLSEPTDAICVKSNPEVGTDKVLALTFDEGPSEEYTAEILDILKENDAHATFFCVGTEIEKYLDDLVRRERDEGHQVCTGTYDHARSSQDGKAASLDDEALVEQVEHGRQVLADALGDEEASRIVRLPGGELNENMIRALDQHVEADIGWNVDTGDWMESSKSAIYQVLMTLESGDIVLCHDGGGDHSGTVEALREALPKLRDQGYSFVTIDDLLEYPSQ